MLRPERWLRVAVLHVKAIVQVRFELNEFLDVVANAEAAMRTSVVSPNELIQGVVAEREDSALIDEAQEVVRGL